jgi:hypothetical protein
MFFYSGLSFKPSFDYAQDEETSRLDSPALHRTAFGAVQVSRGVEVTTFFIVAFSRAST